MVPDIEQDMARYWERRGEYECLVGNKRQRANKGLCAADFATGHPMKIFIRLTDVPVQEHAADRVPWIE